MGRLWLKWGDQLTSFKNSRNLRAIVGVMNICSQENSRQREQPVQRPGGESIPTGVQTPCFYKLKLECFS